VAELASWLEVHFREPLLLLGIVLGPLVVVLAERLPSAVTYSSLALLNDGPSSFRVHLARLPAWLLGLAATLLAIALAGPRSGEASTRERREGIAIAMVVDRSGSMAARDFVEGDLSIDRLTVVKRVFEAFVAGGDRTRGRPDDLIGLVAFARYADGLCPLTLDHGNLLAILEDLSIAEQGEDGTAIGDGLALAVERLRKSTARSKIAVLLTDGVHNAGALLPKQAADLAASLGVRVYVIGAGRTGIAPVPVQGLDGREVLRPMPVEIDRKTLADVAERTGGRYFDAGDEAALQQVVAEIDRLERSQIQETRFLVYEERYAGFAIASAVAIALSTLLGSTLLRRLP
jgi:Ca-activated chloride channel homolog